MNEELNRKLAEWAGFKRIWRDIAEDPIHNREFPHHWLYPNGYLCGQDRDLPRLTSSLDACFKWLVPELKHFNVRDISFSKSWDGRHWWCVLSLNRGDTEDVRNFIQVMDYIEGSEIPALALCKAIEQLLEEAKDESR